MIFIRQYKQSPAWVAKAYQDFSHRRQTYAHLTLRYGKSEKTLRKHFDAHAPATGELRMPAHPVSLTIDATFFSRTDGLLVCRAEGRNVYWTEIQSETIAAYAAVFDVLDAAGLQLSAVVIDGRKGVRQMLEKRYLGLPIQHCQFHQLLTMTTKLTKRPKLLAAKELRRLSLTLTKSTQLAFTSALDAWYEQWADFLQERSYSNERKRQWRYTHERLRSAYFSLQRNLPWLFTYQVHPNLKIPNTTNSCDGSFGHWKAKVRLHRRLAKHRRKKMIDALLERL